MMPIEPKKIAIKSILFFLYVLGIGFFFFYMLAFHLNPGKPDLVITALRFSLISAFIMSPIFLLLNIIKKNRADRAKRNQYRD